LAARGINITGDEAIKASRSIHGDGIRENEDKES
jgi:hypothetical protein